MQKLKTAVLVKILVGAVLVVVGISIAIYFFSNKTESYRSILVYELEGSAEIERNGAAAMNAVENLYLESGDRVKTAADSNMRLKLDDDKYVMVEEESAFRIEATGSKSDSKTSIYLEQGAITNEIQNKLSDKSSYEVTTPNSVMAVRGTIFRVEIYFDENGDAYTKLSVFGGKVTAPLVYPDGSTGEEVQIEAGKEVIIHSNEEITEYLGEPSNIDYQDFSLQTLNHLQELIGNGASITGTTQEELEIIIQNLKNADDSQNDSQTNAKAETESDAGAGTESETGAGTGSDAGAGTGSDAGAGTESETGAGTESDAESDTGADEVPDTETEPETAEYTVTFLYKGKVFGTQKVENGQKVMRPKLNPAGEGEWDFDFSQAIEEDINIEWK